MPLQSTITLRHLRRTIGRNIHELRRRRRWSLNHLAKKIKITPNRLDHLEMGRHNMQLLDIIQIAEALEVDCLTLMQPSTETTSGTGGAAPKIAKS